MNEHQQQFALGLLAYAVQRGVSAEQLASVSGINIELLKRREETGLSYETLTKLWRNATHMTSDPLFGLHFGESLQLAALGTVGEIIKTSETVGQGVTLAATFIPVITDLYTMKVKKNVKTFVVQLEAVKDRQLSEVARQIAEFLMVFTIHELNGLLLRKVQPVSIRGPFKNESHHEYERVFRCEPVLSKGMYAAEFDAQLWDEPILTANYDLQKIFLEKAGARTAGNDVSFQVRIMNYLMTNACLGILSLEDVAANFNMTPRSLQRRLQEEGTTFQQIADSVRKSLALSYMESGKYRIKEISNMLGYNELSAFSRAFKRWTGKAPMGYQA